MYELWQINETTMSCKSIRTSDSLEELKASAEERARGKRRSFECRVTDRKRNTVFSVRGDAAPQDV